MNRANLLATAGMLLVTGCTVGPDYERPDLDTPVPEGYVNPAAGPTLADALPDSTVGADWRWWEDFGDTTLNSLVEDALVHNNDLARAVGRVLEARAGLTGAKAPLWPSFEIGGQASRSKRSEGLPGFGPLYSNFQMVGLSARYELDLWGKLARGKEAAVATLLASEQNRRTVAQTLIADVVRTWLQIRELQLQVALTERTIASFESSLATVHERYRRGLVGPLDLHLAGQNLSTAEAQLPVFEGQLTATRRRMEILAGRYPSGTIVASDLDDADGGLREQIMPEPLEQVPAGLPSDLLERRPDLLAAEAELASNTARIGEAKARLYPSISLTADAGTRSDEFDNLFATSTDAWSLVGNLLMPIINRGATQAQIQAAEARTMQATANYRATVLRAFSEVENALDQDIYQARQEEHLIKSVEQSRLSVQLAEERYRRGLDNLLTTLESQRRLFNSESGLLTTQRQRRTARVDLILALGGPWEIDPATLAMNDDAPDVDDASHEGAEQ